MGDIQLPNRKSDAAEILTTDQITDAIVMWLKNKKRIPDGKISHVSNNWYIQENPHDNTIKIEIWIDK